MKRRYIFEDFQLSNTGDKDVNMECGIAIPIRNTSDLPADIAQIINDSVAYTMERFERKYGKVSELSSLRLEGYLQVDENGSNKHYIGLILYDELNNEKTDIDIQPKDKCYLSFARYCASRLNQYFFCSLGEY